MRPIPEELAIVHEAEATHQGANHSFNSPGKLAQQGRVFALLNTHFARYSVHGAALGEFLRELQVLVRGVEFTFYMFLSFFDKFR